MGHNITLSALGVFILWFAWFGLNSGLSLFGPVSPDSAFFTLSTVFFHTALAAAFSAFTALSVTWVRYKKPDISMTLSGTVGGLVAVSAGCSLINPLGAAAIGIVAGLVVVYGIEFIDKILKIDDPVGVAGVHGFCGLAGTLLVGVFALDGGLLYGGGFISLATQALGALALLAWVLLTMATVFALFKKTGGLRVSEEVETLGLDAAEHGLTVAYADFMPMVNFINPVIPVEDAVPVESIATNPLSPDLKMSKVVIITKQSKFEALNVALNAIGITGMTVTQVMGCGIQKGHSEFYRGVEVEMTLLPKIKIEIIVSTVPAEAVVDTAKRVLYTGHIGDGKIFVYNVENVVKIRTGEEGPAALQDIE